MLNVSFTQNVNSLPLVTAVDESFFHYSVLAPGTSMVAQDLSNFSQGSYLLW